MAMSRKHYQAVADVLKNEYEAAVAADDFNGALAVAKVAEGLAGAFKRDNGAFSYGIFFKAAGIEVPARFAGAR